MVSDSVSEVSSSVVVGKDLLIETSTPLEVAMVSAEALVTVGTIVDRADVVCSVSDELAKVKTPSSSLT